LPKTLIKHSFSSLLHFYYRCQQLYK